MINLQNFLNTTQRWNDKYAKIASPILINNQPFHFVPQVDGKIYSTNAVVPPFRINNTFYNMAKKGYRPTFNKRLSLSFPNAIKYLIKFNDGELRLCDNNISPSSDIMQREGHVVGSAKDDLHYVYLLLQGGGGGGSGSTWINGAGGGASGALVVACICVDFIWKITCAGKGTGGDVSLNGNKGGDSIAECNGFQIVAPGGNGGECNGKASNCALPVCSNNDICHGVLLVQGARGGAPNGDGDKFSAVVGEKYGHIDEEPISFAEVPKAGTASGLLHGGGGGSSAFGRGGYGPSASTIGGNAEAIGAGGGGAGQTIAKKGGNGGDGVIEIFY